jgi:uncharacterized membrane protein YozB (DUF420 family)
MTTEVLRRSPVRPPLNRTRERIFFGLMSVLMIGTILLGFRQSYFPLGPRPDALASPVIIVHGTIFSLYLLLFGVQTTLISARRVQWHMKLGLAVYTLAAIMVPLGILAAADELRRDLITGVTPFPGIDPRTFSIVSVTGMALFGSLIAWSYIARRQPAAHKRLVLYATLAMMDAGIERWPWDTWGISQSWAPWVFYAFLLLPVLYDLISLHRIHWATMVAAPYVWILHRLEFTLGRTHAWHSFTNLLLKLSH